MWVVPMAAPAREGGHREPAGAGAGVRGEQASQAARAGAGRIVVIQSYESDSLTTLLQAVGSLAWKRLTCAILRALVTLLVLMPLLGSLRYARRQNAFQSRATWPTGTSGRLFMG